MNCIRYKRKHKRQPNFLFRFVAVYLQIEYVKQLRELLYGSLHLVGSETAQKYTNTS